MSYQKEECTIIQCDNCGEVFQDLYNDFTFFPDDLSAHDTLDGTEWHETADKKHYCPDCHKIDDQDNLIISIDRKKVAELRSTPSISVQERDEFAMSFCAWYSHAEDAQVYKSQNLPGLKMLELYKSRPYLRTDSPEEN